MNLTISAFQGEALYDELEKSLQIISKNVKWAEANNVDIICFPECFLQGYILDRDKAYQVSLELESIAFSKILKRLAFDNTTIILGLIERDRDNIFNTAVVIEGGKLIGRYRKHFIHIKETIFTCGLEFPIFVKKGIRYGINICYDNRFPESADALVKQGAKLIFCPLNNSLPHVKADEWRHKHINFLVNKAEQSGCWIVSADIVEQSQTKTGYGCTCLIDPKGKVMDYLEHSKIGKFLNEINVD